LSTPLILRAIRIGKRPADERRGRSAEILIHAQMLGLEVAASPLGWLGGSVVDDAGEGH